MVLALAVVGLTLRCIVTRSIWLDEAISIAQAKLPLGQMLTRLATEDVHPPLHHVLLWLTVRILGAGEFAVRTPSIVAGTILIPILYLAGRGIYGRRVGLTAAALTVVAPIAVWYSQEARMYAVFMLFAVIAVWAQIRALRGGQLRWWLVYSLSTATMVWTQYFAVFQLAVQQMAFAVALLPRRGDPAGRRLLIGWIGSTLLIAILLLPLAGFMHSQLDAYTKRGAGLTLPAQAGLHVSQQRNGLSIYAIIANAIWALWGYHANSTMAQIVALWPLGMLLALVLLGRGYSRTSTFLLAIAAGPGLALFTIGLFRRNLFELRYFVGAVPVGLLLIARCVTSANTRAARVMVAGLLVGTLVVGLADQQLNGANPRLYDFRGALAIVSSRARPGDIVIYEPQFIGPVIDYYAAQLNAKPLDSGLPMPGGGNRVFLVGSFLDEPRSASQVGDALHTLDATRRPLGEFRRPNVRVWVFR